MAENVLKFDFLARDRFSATADKVAQKTDSLAGKIGKFGKATAIAFGAVAAGGVLALGKAFKDGVDAADEYQKVSLKTAAVIKSTGNQAHISVKGVQSLAAELEGLGTTDEELIINSQNVLATFTNIRNVGKNKIFDEATRSTLDMSVALGSDLQGASIQVGKALNDPIKGVGALSKVGVTFTAQQKDQIKTLVESGRTMDAQKIILSELNKEFGGAAKAAGSGFSGAVFRAKDAIGDLQRDIAMKALPVLTKFADWATDTGVPKLRAFSDWMGKKGVPRIISGFQAARDGVEAAWSKLDLSGLGSSIIDQAKDWGGLVLLGVQMGLKSGDWSELGRILGNGLATALKAGASGGADIGAAIGKWFASVDWLNVGEAVGKTVAPFALGVSLTLVDGLVDAFKKHPGKVLFAIATLIPVGKILTVFKPLRAVLEALPFGKWIAKGLEKTAAPAFDAVWRFIKFAGRGIAKGFREIIPAADGWVGRLVRNLGDGLRLRAMYLADRAVSMIQGIFVGIGRMAGRAARAAGRVIVWLTRPFVNSGRWLVAEGRSLIGGLIGGIADRGSALLRSLGGLIGRVTGRFSNAGRWLVLSGRRLLAGLYDGMVSKVADAASWAANIGGRIVRAVKSYFGIASPSKVFTGIGRNLITSLFGAMINSNPVGIVKKIFGGMPQALGAMVNKGLVKIANLPKKALSALSGLGGKFADLLGFGGGGGGLSGAERYIIMHESGGRTDAQNPTSTAFGLGQLIYANRAHYGAILGVSPNTTNYGAQLSMFRMYVKERYGNADNAASFWRSHHWYDQGGVATGAGFMAKKTLEPERVLSPMETRAFDRLSRVTPRLLAAATEPGAGPAIDYTRLGEQVARAFVSAGVTVRMDGRAVGQVMGSTANLLGRAG